jgi:hypothetical protein
MRTLSFNIVLQVDTVSRALGLSRKEPRSVLSQRRFQVLRGSPYDAAAGLNSNADPLQNG